MNLWMVIVFYLSGVFTITAIMSIGRCDSPAFGVLARIIEKIHSWIKHIVWFVSEPVAPLGELSLREKMDVGKLPHRDGCSQKAELDEILGMLGESHSWMCTECLEPVDPPRKARPVSAVFGSESSPAVPPPAEGFADAAAYNTWWAHGGAEWYKRQGDEEPIRYADNFSGEVVEIGAGLTEVYSASSTVPILVYETNTGREVIYHGQGQPRYKPLPSQLDADLIERVMK